jgi:antitoxin ParD1/3/4
MTTPRMISVDLGAQRASLQRRLESGQYENASEVLRDALRALDWRDAALDELLRAEVRASMADKRSPVPAEIVFQRLEARHARKMKAAKRGA